MPCKPEKGVQNGFKIRWILNPLVSEYPPSESPPMSIQSVEFRTRKGNRVYRRRHTKNGQEVLASHFTFRVKQDGGSHYFNLGTTKNEAGATADEIAAFLRVEGNTVKEALLRYSEKHKNKALREAKAPKPVEAILTVGGIITAYAAISAHLSPTTVKNNTAALRHVAAGILGLDKLGVNQTKAQRLKWRSQVDPFPVSGFTAQQVEEFRQNEIRKCGTNFKKRGATSTTLNSYMRSCRSIFAQKLIPLYEGLNLPEPLPFRGIAPLPEPSHRYQSKIGVEKLIEEAKKSIYITNKDAWAAFLLCFGVGLRREEIDKLMIEQVDIEDRRVWIRTTEFFRPKAKNSEASVDLSPPIAAFLKEYLDAIPERKFVLPGREVSGKLRCQTTFRALMKWLRENGVSERTPLHTLRKEAGSLIFEKSGSIDLTAEFLRNDPRIAREHYIGKKSRLELELPGL